MGQSSLFGGIFWLKDESLEGNKDSDVRGQKTDVSEIPPLSIRRHRSGNSSKIVS